MKNLTNYPAITFTSLVLFIFTNLGFAQSTYLKVTKSNTKYGYVSYPPGTLFELKDKDGVVVFSDKNEVGSFPISEQYTLYVSPTYKSTTDTILLSEGKIELVDNSTYFDAIETYKNNKKTSKDYGTYTYDKNTFTKGLTMKKTLEISPLNPNTYNATFEFSNGIKAMYMDGEMVAILNDEQLKIEGRYLIYSEFGLIKLSFRPSNGETWWVFEPKK